MPGETLLYLSRKDVEATGLSESEIFEAVEISLKAKGRGLVEMPPKPGIHTKPDAFIHAMPAYISSIGAAGMKWVSGYPENQIRGLPYVTGLIILNDTETGLPIAVLDCSWITAKRTAAATAVAAKYLARKDSSSIGIVACGVQGRSNLQAICNIFNVKNVRSYDISKNINRIFADEMSGILNVDIEPVDNVKKAVRGMDIVITSGPILKDPEPAIKAGWLSEGAFACPLDFDSYWTGAAFNEASKIATDDTNQMAYYRRIGYFKKTPEAYADLGQIVTGNRPGRESAGERIICINLGLAIEDMAVASLTYKRAIERNIGVKMPL